jgi:hypothetical protein
MASQVPRRLNVLEQKYAGVPGLGAMLSLLERCIVRVAAEISSQILA